MDKKLAYSIKEAMQALSLGRCTILDLINRGKLGYVQVGRRKIIPRVVIEKWLEENLVTDVVS